MLEAHHVKKFREDRNEYRTLNGVRVVQLCVTNLTSDSKTVELLGDSNNRKNFNSGDVEIKNNTDYYTDDDNNLTLLRNYINAVGYIEVVLIRLQSTNSAQVSQIISVTKKDSTGNKQREAIIAQNYFSANQFQSGILDIPRQERVDSNTSFSFTVLGTTTYVVTMFCGKNKGDVKMKVKSFVDDIQDEIDNMEHYVPKTTEDKKRILTLLTSK